MSYKSKKVSFKNSYGDLLDARLELPNDEASSYAIFVHCFTCSKDVHAAARVSRRLTAAGIGVLRFDFTGLGNSDGDFSNTNFSTSVSDLISAYEYMHDNKMTPELLIGHSLGGATVLAAAGNMPTLKGVVTISAPSEINHVEELFKNNIQEIETYGKAEVDLAGRGFIIRKQFLDDIRSIILDDKLKTLKPACLIFHSPQDKVVPYCHAQTIFNAVFSSKSLISLEGANHLLDRKEDSEYVARIISAWIKRYLME